MNRLLYKLKNDKLFLILFASISAVVLFDLFMIVFDIVQFVKISQNSVNLFNGFVALNVFAGVINILAITAILVYFILNKRRIKTENKMARK
ncbi:MAG: hypothetical protein IJA23_00760 [Clostridia bacterium]|nr:hypothetical protein [Clostridia bacterium]